MTRRIERKYWAESLCVEHSGQNFCAECSTRFPSSGLFNDERPFFMRKRQHRLPFFASKLWLLKGLQPCNVLLGRTLSAIFDQEIEDHHIEQTREQARRVGVASNGPIHVDGSRVGDESSQKDERQDNPMTTKIVKEQVADRNRSNGPRVEPKEHSPGIGRPEVVCDPLHKPAVKKCLVKDMNDV